MLIKSRKYLDFKSKQKITHAARQQYYVACKTKGLKQAMEISSTTLECRKHGNNVQITKKGWSKYPAARQNIIQLSRAKKTIFSIQGFKKVNYSHRLSEDNAWENTNYPLVQSSYVSTEERRQRNKMTGIHLCCSYHLSFFKYVYFYVCIHKSEYLFVCVSTHTSVSMHTHT